MPQLARKPLDPEILGKDGKPTQVIRAYELKGCWPTKNEKTRLVIKYGRDQNGQIFGRVYVTDNSKEVKGRNQLWTHEQLRYARYEQLPLFMEFAERLGLPTASAIGKLILQKIGDIPEEVPEAVRTSPRKRRIKQSDSSMSAGA